ncbi:MAG: hypothetical protein ACE5F1_01900 [Planctomycetota bacterium]
MNPKQIACLTITSIALLLPGQLFSHGGRYRGPGDTVPPNPGGGRTGGSPGPGTPGPGGPTHPTVGRPSTPGCSSPGPLSPTPNSGPGGGGGRGGPRTGGVSLADDLSLWTYWWEYNNARFLELKKAIHREAPVTGDPDFIMGRGLKDDASDTLAPGRADRRKIAVALGRVLEETTNRDIISSALVGLAKVGGDRSILSVFRKFLVEQDQEKRETATLAMGIAALEEAVPDLIALALDEPLGRRLVKRPEVDFRTRSFACYGLGLIAYRTKNAELRQRVFEAMRRMVERGTKQRVHRDLIVSPLQAIRLLRPDPDTPAGSLLRADAVEFLSSFMARSDRQVYAQVRSHAYVAVAELLGRGGDSSRLITRRMLDDVKNRRQKSWIHQSAILALGRITERQELEVSKAIRDYMQRGEDLQARSFSAIALGQIGGEANRSFLYSSLKRARTQQKPWIALGLAVRDFNARRRNPDQGDRTACQAIREAFKQTKNPLRLEDRSQRSLPRAFAAVALGLVGDQEERPWNSKIAEDNNYRASVETLTGSGNGILDIL